MTLRKIAAIAKPTRNIATKIALCVVLCALLSVLAMASGTVTTFNAPGAGTGKGQGTLSIAVNQTGATAGGFIDADNAYHGFTRTPGASGTVTAYNAPGAGTAAYQGTWVWEVNDSGDFTGFYIDKTGVQHGFVVADGAFKSFEVSGAAGTAAGSINSAGEVAGTFGDKSGVSHGFVRSASGAITKFNAPGAGTSSGQGTQMAAGCCLNTNGDIAGYYLDSDNVYHGYVRATDGTVTPFNVPGAGTGAYQGTVAGGINDAGTIVGDYIDPNGAYHGFICSISGANLCSDSSTIEIFNVPGAGTGSGQGTEATYVNADGVVIGEYIDKKGVAHGFARSANGKSYTKQNVSGAGTKAGDGTVSVSDNASGTITGSYIDASGAYHGFVLIP